MFIRSLSSIARDIEITWPNMSLHARPYAKAMLHLDKLDSHYYNDTATSVVLYFLSNASTWRGPDAKRIKAELKSMLKAHQEKESI